MKGEYSEKWSPWKYVIGTLRSISNEDSQKIISYLMKKPTKRHMRHAKTQISLGIRQVWSESSLCAQWVAKGPSFLYADSKDSYHTIHLLENTYVHFAYVILTWLSSIYHSCGAQKGVIMGHVGDTAFLPGHITRSRGWYGFKNPYHYIRSTRRSCLWLRIQISNRRTCQKEKCMINRLWYGNFHIIPHINPRHPYQPEGWYGRLGLICGTIWIAIW